MYLIKIISMIAIYRRARFLKTSPKNSCWKFFAELFFKKATKNQSFIYLLVKHIRKGAKVGEREALSANIEVVSASDDNIRYIGF